MARFLALVMASVVSGVLPGLVARLAMRFVALESGLEGGFSLGGSVEVVAFGALIGVPSALPFFLARRRLQMSAPWPGLLWAAVVFVALALVRPPAALSALEGTPDTPAATVAAFAVAFAAWGLLLEGLFRLVGRRWAVSS
jgi:hypothetical protein